MIDVTAVDAFTRLSGVLSALNTNVANRFAFSGVTTDMPALADAARSWADLGLVTAALTDAASVEAAVDVWFDTPGGGYDTVAYTGATTGIAPVRVAEGQPSIFPIPLPTRVCAPRSKASRWLPWWARACLRATSPSARS